MTILSRSIVFDSCASFGDWAALVVPKRVSSNKEKKIWVSEKKIRVLIEVEFKPLQDYTNF